jgi:hypothetical protein
MIPAGQHALISTRKLAHSPIKKYRIMRLSKVRTVSTACKASTTIRVNDLLYDDSLSFHWVY